MNKHKAGEEVYPGRRDEMMDEDIYTVPEAEERYTGQLVMEGYDKASDRPQSNPEAEAYLMQFVGEPSGEHPAKAGYYRISDTPLEEPQVEAKTLAESKKYAPIYNTKGEPDRGVWVSAVADEYVDQGKTLQDVVFNSVDGWAHDEETDLPTGWLYYSPPIEGYERPVSRNLDTSEMIAGNDWYKGAQLIGRVVPDPNEGVLTFALFKDNDHARGHAAIMQNYIQTKLEGF